MRTWLSTVYMPIQNDLLGQLRREWRRLGRSTASCLALCQLKERHPDAGFGDLHDLCDVVDALDMKSRLSVIERAEILRILLEDAHDPLICRTLLQTLIPGIVSVCRQLRFGEGIISEPSEVLATALSFTNELLVKWAGESRQYSAPDILSALKGRMRRWISKEREALKVVSNFDQGDPPDTAASPLLARLNSYYGSRYERVARITYLRVFEGRSLRDLARADHSSYGSLQAELKNFAIKFLL